MKNQLSGLIRHGLTAIGGFIVAKGFIEESLIEDLIGAVMTLIGIIWSVASKKKAA